MCETCARNKSTCSNSTLENEYIEIINKTIPNEYCTSEHIELIHSGCFCPANARYRRVSHYIQSAPLSIISL